MLVKCPQCSKQLKLSDKFCESLSKLEAGRVVKVKCVHCQEPFEIGSDTVREEVTLKMKASVKPVSKDLRPPLTPPAQPDVSWLKEGVFEGEDEVEDIPRALVLIPESPTREIVVGALNEFGYLVERIDGAEEAIEKLRFVNYAAVFLHQEFEKGGFDQGEVHAYMRVMNMSRRRYIFYVLIGEQLNTLYDLQALSYSANLVVNDGEIAHVGVILKKTIPEYERLFGALMEEMRVAGK